eukprot:gene8988-9068_t
MPIEIGESLPFATFRSPGNDGPISQTTGDVFAGKRVVLFAVPGAFTPTCHKNHLPGYLDKAEAIKAKGVDVIAVTSVNDVHVMAAWAKVMEVEGRIEFLADGNGDFAKAVDLAFDASGGGMGLRSKRYSMLVEDGVVKSLNIEDAPGKADISGAEAMLKQL